MNARTSKQNRVSLNRIFHTVNQGWFVEAREGRLGPYLNYLEASRAMRLYVQDSLLKRQRLLTAEFPPKIPSPAKSSLKAHVSAFES